MVKFWTRTRCVLSKLSTHEAQQRFMTAGLVCGNCAVYNLYENDLPTCHRALIQSEVGTGSRVLPSTKLKFRKKMRVETELGFPVPV